MYRFDFQLARSFIVHSHREAFVAGNERLSYRDLTHMALGIIAKLEEQCPDQRLVAVVNRGDGATYAALLACWFSGRGYVPLEADDPPARIEEILEQSGANAVLDSSNLPLPGLPTDALVMTTAGLRVVGMFDVVANPTAIAYVLFTSGSTGVPKAVPIRFSNLNALFAALDGEGFGHSPHDRWLQMARLSFDLSILSFVPCWLSGGTLCLPSKEGPKYLAILQLIEAEQLTVLPMVPSVLKLLRPFTAEISHKHVRCVILGGEPFPEALAHEWAFCFPHAQFFNFYGPTEGTIVTTIYRLERGSGARNLSSNGILAIGKPLWPDNVCVLNAQGQEAREGELHLCGPMLFSGYLNAAVPLIDYDGQQWYPTGDRVREAEDGQLLFLGRIDRQVQIEGHRVEPGELESVVASLTGLTAVAFTTTHQHFDSQRIVLVLESPNPPPASLAEQLKQRLPARLLPTIIHTTPKLPRTADNAIDLPTLRSQFEAKQ